ncbi:MAG TPA: SRPBCC domain-containing protein [Rhizomicrobium sp.]|jgi:glutathione S-transferase
MAHEIVEELFIAAPPDRLFDAWTQAAHMMVWWKNDGEFVTEHFENDLRVGGKWLVRFRMPDGNTVGAQGEYRQVERPNALSFTWAASWDAGGPTLIELEFLPSGDGTLVKLRHSGFDEAGWRDANKKVWEETLDWLRCYLTS